MKHMFFFSSLLFLKAICFGQNVVMSELEYKGTPHFRVETTNATYYIEKQSGGCSSLIDRDGNDWINFSKTGNNNRTNSADSDFRGMPNLVHKMKDSGVGHPGFDQCTTEKICSNSLRTTSHSKLWQFTWRFLDDCAILDIENTDTTRTYWFLYEGPIMGRFNPSSHYWGNDLDGIRSDCPVYKQSSETGNWQWAFFGDQNIDRVLFFSMTGNDTLDDFYACMGNDPLNKLQSEDGMSVFGFGRSENTTPLLKGKNSFVFGFYEKKIISKHEYQIFREFISTRMARISNEKLERSNLTLMPGY